MEMNQKVQQITDPEEAKDRLLIRGSSWNKYSVKTWGKWTWNLLKQFIEPQGLYLLIWYAIFILTSVAGIAVDPLMLYIPIIHKNKCLGVDRKLMILALLSRSFTDLFYVIDIIYQIRALVSVGIFETSFAASICVLGLVIFIYLIGNVQTFMQFEATRTEETRLKMKLKEEDVKSWLTSHGLKNKLVDYTNIFMPKIQFYLKKNKDVEVQQNMFSILDHKDKRSIKRHLIKFTDLKKVPLLQNVHPQILEEIIEHMEPLMYPEHSYIVHEGEPLGLMLFITQGTAWTFNSNQGSNILSSISAECLKEGSFFGAELIEWAALRFTSVFGVPISPTNVKTHKKVEALAITYEDLKKIVLKFWSKFSEQKIQNRTSSKVQQMAACVIQEAWRSHRRSVEITSCSSTINSPSKGIITVSRIQDDGNTNQEKLL